MADVECPECGKNSHRTEVEKQICLNEHFKKILKKWSLVTLAIVAIAIPYFIGSVWAQEYQDVSLQVNGKQIPISIGNPALTSIPAEAQVYTTIHLAEPESISCTLSNCVSSLVVDNTFGGYSAKISGVMENQTAEIQTINGQGIPAYTILMQPTDVSAQLQREFQQGAKMSDWTYWAGALVGLGLIPIGVVIGGTTLGIFVTIRHMRNLSRRNRGWRN